MDGSLISLPLRLALLCCPGKVMQQVRGRANFPAFPPMNKGQEVHLSQANIIAWQMRGRAKSPTLISLGLAHLCLGLGKVLVVFPSAAASEGWGQLSWTHPHGASSLACMPAEEALSCCLSKG